MNLVKKMFIFGLILTFSASSFAKEYIVGFKDGNFKQAVSSKIGFMSSTTIPTLVLKNLEMVIVDVQSTEDLMKVKADSNVAFIESLSKFKAPPKRHSLPGDVFGMQKFSAEYPWGIYAVKAPDAWPMSNSGAGIKVLVLDTGVDKDHPALVGRFVEGRNLIPNDRRTGVPYPYFDDNSHGTHVAGTILADNFANGVVGVAPAASLYVGRVCAEFCNGSAIFAGIDWAIEEGIHVVNMSLGGGFPTPGAEAAYKKAEEAGVLIVAASGNDGRNSISYPAKYSSILSVGAINEAGEVADFSNWDSDLDVVAPGVNVVSSVPQGTGRGSFLNFSLEDEVISPDSIPMDGSNAGVVESMPIQYVGLGTPADFEGVDLTGKIALISRGEIAFGDKAKNAMAANAEAVIIFNNVDGPFAGTLGDPLDVIAVSIDKATGDQIVAALTNENAENPTILAGISIEATDYGPLQGTSMATPHVAGVAALVRAANLELGPVEAKNIIKTTVSAPEGDNTNGKFGRGIANALSAVEKATQN